MRVGPPAPRRQRTTPVLMHLPYRTLLAHAVKGDLVYPYKCCPKCGVMGQLFYLGTRVGRGAVFPTGSNGASHQQLGIPFCRCRACGARLRVLPRELLPYKTFGLAVMAGSTASYTSTPKSLRVCAGQVGPDGPHFRHSPSLDRGLGRAASRSRRSHAWPHAHSRKLATGPN